MYELLDPYCQLFGYYSCSDLKPFEAFVLIGGGGALLAVVLFLVASAILSRLT